MRKPFCFLLLFAFLALAFATASTATYVKGYVRKDGTYVNPYHRDDFGSSYSTPKNKSYDDDYGSSPQKSYSSPNNFTLPDNDVSVKGYYRQDGTYVRPYHRSAPNEFKWDNYGKPSNEQRKEFEDLPELPSYKNDYDKDSIPNRLDRDDDNDSTPDDQE